MNALSTSLPPVPATHGPTPRAEAADWRWWFAIVLTAGVLRAIFLVQFLDYPLANELHMDMLIHHEWASAIAAGEHFWDGAYFRAPLYPWLLGIVYRVFGPDPLPARIAQIVLGSFSCGFLFWIGRRVFGRRAGILAGFLGATYGTLMYFDVQLLIPVLIVFLDLILLLLLLRAGESPSAGRWVAAGIALGLSGIARPNVLLFAPFLVLWQLFLLGREPKRFLGHAACLTLGTLIAVLPVTVRNVVVGGEFSLVATQGGVNWYIGNNPGSDGMTAILPGDPADWWGCYNAQVERAETELGRELNGTEVSRYYSDKVLEFWRDDPAAGAALILRKLGFFWTSHEIANNQDISLVWERYTPLAQYTPIGFWLIGPLGVLGLVLSLRRARELFPLWGFVLIYMASVVAFFVTARYRIPVVNVLVVLAAGALVWIFQALRARRLGALLAALLVILPMAWVGSRVPGTPAYVRVQGLRTLGLQAINERNYSGAESFLAEACEITDRLGSPDSARTRFYLGYARQEQGDLEGALTSYARALNINPRFRELRWRMGQVQRDLKRPAKAEIDFRAAIERNPEHAQPRAELVMLLLELGRTTTALEQAETNLAALPNDPLILWSTALARRDSGDTRGARQLIRTALKDPALAQGLRNRLVQLRETL